MAGPAPYPGGYQPYGPMVTNPFDSRATTVLVLGILGLVLCQVLAPFAWVMGNNLRNEATSAGYPEPGTSKAGRICGIVGTVLLALTAVIFVIAIIAAASSSTSSGY